MKSNLIFLFLVLSFGQGMAQVSLSRQVVGAAGASSGLSTNVDLSHTTGEAVVSTISNASTTLTQGFHQPNAVNILEFEIISTSTTCPFAADGMAEVQNIGGCPPPYQVLWSNGIEGLVVSHLTAGMYTVEVRSDRCSLVQSFEILPGPEENCAISFLNAFSPNGDGINDRWEIENIEEVEFQSNRIEIFNRWGQMVWEGSGYDNASVVWDGESKNGNPLADGTYFYIANIADRLYKGYIEMTR